MAKLLDHLKLKILIFLDNVFLSLKSDQFGEADNAFFLSNWLNIQNKKSNKKGNKKIKYEH